MVTSTIINSVGVGNQGLANRILAVAESLFPFFQNGFTVFCYRYISLTIKRRKACWN